MKDESQQQVPPGIEQLKSKDGHVFRYGKHVDDYDDWVEFHINKQGAMEQNC